MAEVKLEGNTIHTAGDLPAVGSKAPDFTLVDRDLKEVSLGDFAGKRKVITINPSLDTGLCAEAARQFGERVSQVPNAVALVITADLPFAQARYCDTNNVDNVVTLSTFRNPAFGRDYGVLIEDGPTAGLNARAVLVLDENDKVLHNELVPEISQAPDYDAAIQALQQ